MNISKQLNIAKTLPDSFIKYLIIIFLQLSIVALVGCGAQKYDISTPKKATYCHFKAKQRGDIEGMFQTMTSKYCDFMKSHPEGIEAIKKKKTVRSKHEYLVTDYVEMDGVEAFVFTERTFKNMGRMFAGVPLIKEADGWKLVHLGSEDHPARKYQERRSRQLLSYYLNEKLVNKLKQKASGDINEIIRIADLTDFLWDRMYIFYPNTDAQVIDSHLGQKWTSRVGLDKVFADQHLFVFLNRNKPVARIEILNSDVPKIMAPNKSGNVVWYSPEEALF
ncbi:MAG: putative ATP-dependent endonuclease of OLD family [Limisphaerales bacterium]|jgi:predicted ATP-dependent endonuclease of OLD family